MLTFIAFFVAGICTAGFVAIWFTTAYKELLTKRNSLTDLDEQLRVHERLYAKARDGPDVRYANVMIETGRMLSCEASKSYNRTLHKPVNRIPALLMGFRAVDEESKQGKKRGEPT